MMAQKTIHYSIYVFLLFLIVYNLLKRGMNYLKVIIWVSTIIMNTSAPLKVEVSNLYIFKYCLNSNSFDTFDFLPLNSLP